MDESAVASKARESFEGTQERLLRKVLRRRGVDSSHAANDSKNEILMAHHERREGAHVAAS